MATRKKTRAPRATPPRKPVKAGAREPNPTAARFLDALHKHQSNVELQKYHRFFQFTDGDRTDTFLGVRMGQVFALAQQFNGMPLSEVEILLESHLHEARAGACSIMARQATHKNTTAEQLAALSALYLRRHDRINNWDLVDLAAYKVLGNHLWKSGASRAVLTRLARSSNPWERRTAMVATFWFIGHKDVEDAFKVAQLLLDEDVELVQKGVGWGLRYAGDVDRKRLTAFLQEHAARMPRVMLRAALEHYPPRERARFLDA